MQGKTHYRDFFTFVKHQTDPRHFKATNPVTLVYYDAFSPNVQPELWTETVFEKLYGIMSSGAVLATYCAKGQVKRNLKSAGFFVETLPGAPGKREMIRAWKGGLVITEISERNAGCETYVRQFRMYP